MKRKFVQALLPFMKDTMNSSKADSNFRKMTAHDILQEIVARRISEKNVDDALARARGVRAPNLALKAKLSHQDEASMQEEEEILSGNAEDMKYAHAEHMALAQRAFMKKWRPSSSSKPKDTKRVRTCYNWGNQHHFIAECPYERVEDHNGRLVRKEMKAKLFPSRNFDKKKGMPPKALVTQEEYPSGDESSDDEGVVATAAIAIAKPSSSSSLFASANESKRIYHNATCLMAHATKVSPPLTPIIPKSLSLVDCVELCDEHVDELDMFMSTLHGEVKMRFEILLDQCNEAIQLNEKHDERIYELEGHAREYADEIATLTQALEEEHDLRLAIEVSNIKLEESHKLEMVKLVSDRDVAQSVANDLRLQNEKLNQIITKSATKFSSSTIVSTSCSTNPSCEKAPSTQDKILDELLNAQKKHGDKTGLGYVSKSKKSKSKKNKNKKKKKKIPAPS